MFLITLADGIELVGATHLKIERKISKNKFLKHKTLFFDQ